MVSYQPVLNQIKSFFDPLGFECYPFKVTFEIINYILNDYSLFQISSYNSCVEEKFQLKYDPHTLGIFVLNGPEMFERAFLPFLKSLDFEKLETLHDPIDEFMNLQFNRMHQVIFFFFC